MKMLISLHSIIPLLLFFLYPACGNAQEASTGQIPGEIAGEVLADKAGFSEEEKEVIRRYYRGPKSTEDDWRKADNDASSYHWGSDDNDGDGSGSSKNKKHKGKKKGGKGMPPGLAKKDELPPGLQKQLQKNGTLPPGLAKRDLPYDLKMKLPKRPDSYKRTVVNEDVVLIEKATGMILDILYGGAKRQ